MLAAVNFQIHVFSKTVQTMNHFVQIAEDDSGPTTLQRAWLSDKEHLKQTQRKLTQSSVVFTELPASVLKYKEQSPE